MPIGGRHAWRAAAFLFAAACATPAAAQDAPPVHMEGLKAAQLFEIADQAVAAGRPQDAEAIYRGLAHDPDVEIRNEARFRLALMLSLLGRHPDAAVELRAILDEKPGSPRVRLELARVLALAGEDAAARRELRQAQAGGLPAEVSHVVDQFANALRSRKPFGASLELALVPDSNINRATDAQTLDTIIAPLELSDDAREQSGLGARIAGQAFFRVPVGAHLAIVPRVSGQGEFYRRKQFDDASASALIGLEWSPGRERFQLSGGGTYRWYGLEPYARTATASLNWQHPLSRRAQLSAALTAADTDYRLNDLQDGALFNAELGIERAFNARSGGGITLSATRQTARDPGYANVAAGATLVTWRELGHTTAFATLTTRGLEADARLLLYPERRRDLLLGGSIGATFRGFKLRGFAPLVRVSYERNFSTVGIYDYRRLAASFGITRAF
ncbi:MAG: surface lipoprotein assembly modifier [Pseudomonadota bacterium]